MEKELEILEIDFLKTKMNHFWSAIFICGGSGITLLLGKPALIGYILGIIGIIVAFIFFNAYLFHYNEAFDIINKLKRGVKK